MSRKNRKMIYDELVRETEEPMAKNKYYKISARLKEEFGDPENPAPPKPAPKPEPEPEPVPPTVPAPDPLPVNPEDL